MNEQKIEIEIPLLLPEIESARDECVRRLEQMLFARRGVLQAHVKYNGNGQQDTLCIHFDPNLTSLAAVKRMARQAGAELTDRFPHVRLKFHGMEAADMAATLDERLAALPGMIHARTNYAAGLVFVAYDRQVLSLETIEKTMRAMGAVPLDGRRDEGEKAIEREEEEGHEHGGGPDILPSWLQERWRLIAVGLAGVFFLVGWLGETFGGLPSELALVFFLLAYVFGGYDIATHAIPGLLRGRFDTDVLMLAAAGGAAVLGEWAEGAFLLFLFSLAHAGEHYALDRARQAINALGELMPAKALKRVGDEFKEVAVSSLQVGDLVVVRPGDRVAADGVIEQGTSSLDQSAITGESVPVHKEAGEQVYAGTINLTEALEIRVSAATEDNTLSRVMALVAEAQSQQSPTQRVTQRFMRWFVPAVLLGALLLTIVPPLFGWLTLEQSFYRAMLLLVAASPCALAVGTPATVLAGIAQAARNGVLIKGGAHLENLGRLTAMAFDKTGTLTSGEFALVDIAPMNGESADTVLRIAAAVEQQSNHPLALAVVQAAAQRNLQLPEAGSLQNVPGKGVRSEIDGETVLVGNLDLIEPAVDGSLAEAQALVTKYEGSGKTAALVSHGGRLLGVLALADRPREGVREGLERLREIGIEHLVMLTGDNETVAQEVGGDLGVTDIRASLLPEEKLTAIRELQTEYGMVAMAGDGVNDAPALATATVGVAMGGAGTAVALETADVALMADDLGKLPFAVGLSRKAAGIIRQNLVISLGIIGLLLVSSVAGLVPLSGAVILHEGSTIVVVLNALRLLAYR